MTYDVCLVLQCPCERKKELAMPWEARFPAWHGKGDRRYGAPATLPTPEEKWRLEGDADKRTFRTTFAHHVFSWCFRPTREPQAAFLRLHVKYLQFYFLYTGCYILHKIKFNNIISYTLCLFLSVK